MTTMTTKDLALPLLEQLEQSRARLETLEFNEDDFTPIAPSQPFPWALALGGLGIGLLAGITIAGALF